MGSATEEEFKEKLLWNVKREVSALYLNELLYSILINMHDRCIPECSRSALIHCVHCVHCVYCVDCVYCVHRVHRVHCVHCVHGTQHRGCVHSRWGKFGVI